jgi:hypothetical protein
VSWEVAEDPSMSMMHLFGFSKEVPYEQLCQTTSLGSALLPSSPSLLARPAHHRSTPEKIGNLLGLATNSQEKRSSVILGGR